jgi:hypothetical protein
MWQNWLNIIRYRADLQTIGGDERKYPRMTFPQKENLHNQTLFRLRILR